MRNHLRCGRHCLHPSIALGSELARFSMFRPMMSCFHGARWSAAAQSRPRALDSFHIVSGSCPCPISLEAEARSTGATRSKRKNVSLFMASKLARRESSLFNVTGHPCFSWKQWLHHPSAILINHPSGSNPDSHTQTLYGTGILTYIDP